MIDFLVSNWKFFACVLFAVVELFIIIFKRPTKVDSIKGRIADVLPLYIEYAERLFQHLPKSGLDKLNFVLNSVKDLLRITSTDYDSYIVELVERVLSTPTKKGELNEK